MQSLGLSVQVTKIVILLTKGYLSKRNFKKWATFLSSNLINSFNILATTPIHRPSFGITLAVKLGEISENGDNSKPVTGKYIFLATEKAFDYLEISKLTSFKYFRMGRIKAIKTGNVLEDALV